MVNWPERFRLDQPIVEAVSATSARELFWASENVVPQFGGLRPLKPTLTGVNSEETELPAFAVLTPGSLAVIVAVSQLGTSAATTGNVAVSCPGGK
jgi:hypothetical protein